MRKQRKKSGLITMFREEFGVGILADDADWKQMNYRLTN